MIVPDEIRKCVAFLGCKTNTDMKYGGTCFFVSIPSEIPDTTFVYCVTAKHNIEMIQKKSIDDKVYIRANLKKESYIELPTKLNQWLYHPEDSSVDVAVLENSLPYETFDFNTVPLSMAVTNEIIKKEGIGIGDEVFMVGLFTSHYGARRNLPIIRTGNLSLMPEEPIRTRRLGDIDAYLIEARSIGGLSGSPVFVHLFGLRQENKVTHLTGHKFYLLGLIHGHWDIPKEKTDIQLEDFASKEKVNMGIAIVIPTFKLLEVINQEKLDRQRKQEIKRLLEEKSPIPGNIIKT